MLGMLINKLWAWGRRAGVFLLFLSLIVYIVPINFETLWKFWKFFQDNWINLGPYAIAFTGIFGGLVALLTYLSTIWWNFYRYLADRHLEILRLAIQNPDFIDLTKTRRYTEEWPLEHPKRTAYEAFASLCWSHARDIYSTRFLVIFFRRTFRKIYANSLERYRQLHRKWLDNHTVFFPDKKFLRFIRTCEWREYFDARTADLLHWENEAADFDETILHPLRVTKNNILLEYIDKIPNCDLKVADMGCGNGTFITILAEKPYFKEICGIDYSDNMVEIAKQKCKNYSHVKIIKMNMRDLSAFYNSFNIAFSLNSILPRDGRDTMQMLREIARTLKPGGKFIAIFPSFDTVEHLKKIEFELFKQDWQERLPGCIGKPLSFVLAWNNIRKIFHGEKRMSRWNRLRPFSMKYLYADDGVNIQRLIHEREISLLLKECGLSLERKDKLCYLWNVATQFHYGHFRPERYHNVKQIWDWFIVAEKQDRHKVK